MYMSSAHLNEHERHIETDNFAVPVKVSRAWGFPQSVIPRVPLRTTGAFSIRKSMINQTDQAPVKIDRPNVIINHQSSQYVD